ncbi:MAG: DUF2520 domain-containing protein [Planctomycetes bacterium]|nr:DUF2520 domain-containing protein [Planctomycetota bacterium]
MTHPSLAIYGVGRFGRALAVAVDQVGLEIVAIGGRSRTESPVDGISLHVGIPDFLAALTTKSLVIIAVPDDAIKQVAQEILNAGQAEHFYVHCAGSRSAKELAPLANRGCFHILQSFPATKGADRVAGSFCAITADGELFEVLESLALSLNLRPINLPDSARTAYHTAAVIASNALIGLADFGRQILETGGIADADKLLLPLMQGTLENLEVSGGDCAEALTGPIARGDFGTVAEHLKNLPEKQRRQYANLMLPLLQLSSADPHALERIKKALKQAAEG